MHFWYPITKVILTGLLDGFWLRCIVMITYAHLVSRNQIITYVYVQNMLIYIEYIIIWVLLLWMMLCRNTRWIPFYMNYELSYYFLILELHFFLSFGVYDKFYAADWLTVGFAYAALRLPWKHFSCNEEIIKIPSGMVKLTFSFSMLRSF